MLIDEFASETPRIAALRGAPSSAMQALLDEFARRRAGAGLRVAGVVEDFDCAHDGACKRFRVRDLLSGETISISQDLGRGSTACNLDPAAFGQRLRADRNGDLGRGGCRGVEQVR